MLDWKLARELAESGELDQAWKIVDEAFHENINDPKALVLASFLLEKANRSTLAYHLSKRLVELYPNEGAGWTNLGKCADDLWRVEESERAYLRAIKLSKEPKHKVTALVNLAALHLQNGDFVKAKRYASEALAIDPENRKGRHNLGISQLALKEWGEAWANYSHSVGSVNRMRWSYNSEPEWKGEKGTVVIYGEQGIGDEINSASMFGDAIRKASKVILDCDARLAGLYRRSFPGARVYGTRASKVLAWDEADRQIEYSISSMQLGGLFRLKAEDFPGTPYLKADPDRVMMWRSLFNYKCKPVIGVAWSGGIKSTGARFRHWSLEDLLPVFRSIDAHWVSLQYRDAQPEIDAFKAKHPEVDLVQYPWATLTKDYDDTAGLVESCDRVICMQTAVAHLCGGLGKQCDVFVPANSQWRYHGTEDYTPWYGSVRVIRQAERGHWSNTLKSYAEKLARDFAQKKAA